jgi:hypothetical protein
MAVVAVRLALGLVLAVMTQASSFALSVIVNGKVLPPTPPAVQRSGHVLLPMRMVFEALGAQVKWEDATQTAIGTRGDVVVRMGINQNIAYINDRAVPLDVPPQLIEGSTYVPVRFPAEAFGARVGWNDAAQVVTVDLAPLPPPVEVKPPTPPVEPPEPPAEPAKPPTPPVTPPTPPTPQPGTVTGVVVAPQANRVTIVVDNELKVFEVTPTTIILENKMQVAAKDLKGGDLAEVQHDGAGHAVIVRATYLTIDGIVQAKVPNQLLLDTQAEPFKVQPEAEIATAAGAAAQYADIKVGDKVTLRLTPGTLNAYGIAIQQPAAAPVQPTLPQVAGPKIEQFYHNADHPLKAADTLTVVLEGTPKGAAWFDIGDVRKRVNLKEVRNQPGRYQVNYRVEAGLTALGVPLIGHLELGGKAAETAQSAEPVTIDTTPPVIQVFGPKQDERTTNRQPNLAILVTDENGSGVDFERTGLAVQVNGKAQPAKVTAHGQFLTLVPDPLPAGNVTVIIDAFDKSGNETRMDWAFVVVAATAPEAAAVLSVGHDAAGVLMPGDALTVTAVGPPGGHATLDLGAWARGLPLPEVVGKPGTYQTEITIPDLAADQTLTARVKLRTVAGATLTAEATTPVRLGPQRDLAPVITSPAEGAKVGQQVVVEGDTQPLSQVTITITWHGTLLRILAQEGQAAETQVTADVHGHFKTDPIPLKVSSILPVKDVTYTVSVVAANTKGQTSDPVEVQFSE